MTPPTTPHDCRCCTGQAVTVVHDLCYACCDALMTGRAPHTDIHPTSAVQEYAWPHHAGTPA